MTTPDSFYDLQPADVNGNPYPFSKLKDKVVLIVNVASKCGFTGQYQGLEELNKKYRDRGLVILGFPCNQFAGQEPGTSEEAVSFCQKNYGVSFDVLQKVKVNGAEEDPVYRFLKSHKAGFLGFSGIKWNFEKFLVDKSGNVVGRWASTTTPASLASSIEKYLDA